jgi:hypothetical protein
VVEAATKEAAIVAFREIHHVTAKEAVAKEVVTAALHEIHYEVAMATLDLVAREAAKVIVHELRHDVAACKDATRMYDVDVAAKKAHFANAAAVAAVWVLVNGDKGEEEEVVVEVENDKECRVGHKALCAAQREATKTHVVVELKEHCRAEKVITKVVTCVAVELAEAEPWRWSWPFTRGRDGEGVGVPEGRGPRKVDRCGEARRHMAARHQEAALRTAMAAIDRARPAGYRAHDDGVAQP